MNSNVARMNSSRSEDDDDDDDDDDYAGRQPVRLLGCSSNQSWVY
jgi:hypothetical protein